MNLNYLASFVFELGLPIQDWQKSIYSLKNIHKGKKCILIGNGPSVSYADLDKINELNCIKFVFNRFHKVYTSIKFEPDYTMSIDPLFIDDFLDELLDEHKGQLLIGHHKKLSRNDEYQWFKLKTLDEFLFSKNPLKYTASGGSVVVAALQLAYYMGCRDFYIYGIDHSFVTNSTGNESDLSNGSKTVQGEGNHFISNYRNGKAWYPPDTAVIEQGFLASRQYIELNGGQLINISRQSKLNIIPKMDFDTFISRYK